jgi:hypothetical protein
LADIKVDATAAIAFANNTASSGRMKHIDVREAWMQDLRSKKKVRFSKIDGAINPADFMTKILSAEAFTVGHDRLMKPVLGVRFTPGAE